MGWFFITVACIAALGLLRLTKSGADSRRYLDAAREEEPLQIEHLSLSLQRFVADTRLLRISLESSVRTIAQTIAGEFEATNDDRDGFDQMLMNVTRSVGDWLTSVDQLPETDRVQITDHGGNPATIRAALEREGWAFERRNLKMPGRPPMNLRLAAILEELRKVEIAVQARTRVYR